MTDGDEARARRDEPLQLRENQVAVLVGGDGPQRGAPLLADALPGHDVGMMVQFRHDDFVARREILPSVGLCHQVDALGGAAHEDDFLAGGGIDEPLHLFAGFLVGIGGTGGQRVGPAVDVRIIRLVVIRNLVDHLDGLLRRSAVVEPYQIVAVHPLVEHGEVLLDLLRVQRVGLFVVQVSEFLRLGDAYAETILLRERPGRHFCVVHVGQLFESAAARQQLLESRLERIEVQGLAQPLACREQLPVGQNLPSGVLPFHSRAKLAYP